MLLRTVDVIMASLPSERRSMIVHVYWGAAAPSFARTHNSETVVDAPSLPTDTRNTLPSSWLRRTRHGCAGTMSRHKSWP
jgi:hypothetical protein